VRYENRERQPGEPSHQTFSFASGVAEQPLSFILTAEGSSVEEVLLEIDGVRRLELPVRLQDGEALVYRGGREAGVYSSRWTLLGTVPVDESVLVVGPGEHRLMVGATMTGGDGGHLKVELRLRGEAEYVAR
jgi:hypothetical protein